MRFFCRHSVAVIIGAAAIIAVLATTGLATEPEAAPKSQSSERSEEWLIAGVVTDARTLCRLAGENLIAVDKSSDANAPLRHIGQTLRNPTLSGVDLSKPIRFFYMNPRKYKQPWVYQFTVSDEAALKQATKQHDVNGAVLHLRINETLATAFFDPKAGQALLRIQKTRPKEMVCRGPGQLRLRANLPQVLKVYESEIAAQVKQMKTRMHEAMTRAPDSPDREQEILRWQLELDATVAALGQVRTAECGLNLTSDHAGLFMRVEPIPGSTLARFVSSVPTGSLALLRRCPGDAILLLAYNLNLTITLKDMILRQIGLAQLIGLPEKANPRPGQTALALFATSNSASWIEALEMTTGGAAEAARQRWAKLSAPDAETPRQAITIRPFQPDPPPVKGLVMAEIIPHPQALGTLGANLLHTFFGRKILAAQDAGEGRNVLVVGQNPAPRIEQIRQLAADNRDSLRHDTAFIRSLEGIPEKPNIFVYVSPKGIWQWLILARISPEALSPIRTGLAAGARFSADGTITAALRLPTRPIREALSSHCKMPRQKAPRPEPKQ